MVTHHVIIPTSIFGCTGQFLFARPAMQEDVPPSPASSMNDMQDEHLGKLLFATHGMEELFQSCFPQDLFQDAQDDSCVQAPGSSGDWQQGDQQNRAFVAPYFGDKQQGDKQSCALVDPYFGDKQNVDKQSGAVVDPYFGDKQNSDQQSGALVNPCLDDKQHGQKQNDVAESVSAQDFQNRAMELHNYIQATGRESATWEDDVMTSKEGAAFWITAALVMNKRAPLGQAFGRALAHQPFWQANYPFLTDALKERFRREWAVKRDFNFVKETKVHVTSRECSTQDLGEHLPLISIAAALGDARHPECLRMAQNYSDMARRAGGNFVSFSPWLGSETFLFMRRLVSETNLEAWKQVLETTTTTNCWEERVLVSKACLHFATAHGRRHESVSQQEVEESTLGIKGWADMVSIVPMASVKRTGVNGMGLADEGADSGTSPPKQKAAKKPPNPTVAAEKQAKEVLSAVSLAEGAVKRTLDEVQDLGESMSWCKKFTDEIEQAWAQCLSKVDALGELQDDFKAAMLSPVHARDMKKQMGEDYMRQLITYAETVGPSVAIVTQKIKKLKSLIDVGAEAEVGAESVGVKRRSSGQGAGKARARQSKKQPVAE